MAALRYFILLIVSSIAVNALLTIFIITLKKSSLVVAPAELLSNTIVLGFLWCIIPLLLLYFPFFLYNVRYLKYHIRYYRRDIAVIAFLTALIAFRIEQVAEGLWAGYIMALYVFINLVLTAELHARLSLAGKLDTTTAPRPDRDLSLQDEQDQLAQWELKEQKAKERTAQAIESRAREKEEKKRKEKINSRFRTVLFITALLATIMTVTLATVLAIALLNVYICESAHIPCPSFLHQMTFYARYDLLKTLFIAYLFGAYTLVLFYTTYGLITYKLWVLGLRTYAHFGLASLAAGPFVSHVLLAALLGKYNDESGHLYFFISSFCVLTFSATHLFLLKQYDKRWPITLPEKKRKA